MGHIDLAAPVSPHLVLQGRPEPDRLPARHGAEGAREGPLLRRLDRHLGRRGGPREGPAKLEKEVNKVARRLRGRAASSALLELRESLERRDRVPRDAATRPASTTRTTCGPTRLDVNVEEARRRRAARSCMKDAAQGRSRPDIADTEAYHRGRRRAHARGLGDLQEMKPKDVDQRRDALPRAQGPLRLPVRLGRVLPRRHGRRSRSATCSSRSTSRPRRASSRSTIKTLEGPEAEPARSSA